MIAILSSLQAGSIVNINMLFYFTLIFCRRSCADVQRSLSDFFHNSPPLVSHHPLKPNNFNNQLYIQCKHLCNVWWCFNCEKFIKLISGTISFQSKTHKIRTVWMELESYSWSVVSANHGSCIWVEAGAKTGIHWKKRKETKDAFVKNTCLK